MREIQHLRISVTSECNLRCKHCYVPDEKIVQASETLRNDHISIDSMIALMDRLREDYGLRKITLSGGEPMLSTIWNRTKPLLKYAVEHDLEVQFNTNGCGDVPVKEINKVVGDKKHLIFYHVSLDGSKPDYVDEFRGVQGVYDKVILFLKTARDNGYTTRIRYTATSKNLDQVEPCYKLAQDLNLDAFLIKPVFPAGYALKNQEYFVILKQYEEIQKKVAELSVGSRTRAIFPQPFFPDENEIPSEANTKVLNCNCGSAAIYLTHTGKIYPCTYLVGTPQAEKYVIGNIQDMESMFAAWEDKEELKDYRTGKKTCPTYDILLSVSKNRK